MRLTITVHNMVTVKASTWLFVLLSLAALLPNYVSQSTTANETCPGLSGGVCGRVCQLHTCKALGRFYRATLNERYAAAGAQDYCMHQQNAIANASHFIGERW